MITIFVLQVRLRDKVNQCSKDAEGIQSKNEELDGGKDKFQFTGYEPWVHGFYSRFDLLKELSLKILENVKFKGGNLFRRLVEKSDSEDDVALGGSSYAIGDGLAYCGKSRGGAERTKSMNRNATQWKTVRPKNNVDNSMCPFGLKLESPVAVK